MGRYVWEYHVVILLLGNTITVCIVGTGVVDIFRLLMV